VWELDPANGRDLIDRLRPHARRFTLKTAQVGEGWRPLVEECHERLQAAFPDYELLAVKQKYGALRTDATGMERTTRAPGRTSRAAGASGTGPSGIVSSSSSYRSHHPAVDTNKSVSAVLRLLWVPITPMTLYVGVRSVGFVAYPAVGGTHRQRDACDAEAR
jgi:hypothetical protein